jgi:NADPH-dependent glutamate synthase beta subunit-like oxidoreductase/NAD-dependent dihydropyrimidine dehydrogenase PreA subunit
MQNGAISLMAKSISVIGSGIRAAQCALTLAELGINVSLITPNQSLDFDNDYNSGEPSHEQLHVWPLLLRAASNPKIKLYTNTKVKSVSGKPGYLTLKTIKEPRYVNEEICTGCGKCEDECSVKIKSVINGRKVNHGAIHSPVIGIKTVPSAYYIEKEGISPCRSDCPLGINVQGFIALIAKGKIDKARALINEVAPMASILGRLCTHYCESNCARNRVDSPVFIKALHRYAADNATQALTYERRSPSGTHKEKIAIIGSGPAGLTSAWELARRGYSPTVFESHSVIGGMLATGIPRFRLPKEIREKEVEAIKQLGVEFKTGVTVGRDVMYNDLIDRGYKAFFLAIGAQQNNKLNIPGEDLNGVLDCISLLFSLNLKVGVSVGSEVVVIGGGNSAVDSARSAKRVSKGDVRILCITEKMTAIQEDVEEAIKEGIIIEYNVSPIEILGDGNNVTGVRCQRVKNVTFETDGRVNLDYIPATEFTLKADRVVVSIGQKPNAVALNIRNLAIGKNTTITADPLTLETSIPGVFAGGDAVTGSNSVVMAMAAGLRAAESIDRYLKSHDLKKGRTIEKPVPVKVDLENRKPTTYKRAHIPILPFSKRKGNYEETNLGLSGEIAKREAERCLNCTICCECLECEQVCELKAINHKDTTKLIDIEADSIINFISSDKEIKEIHKSGVYNVTQLNDKNVPGELAQASAIALSAVQGLKIEDITNISEKIFKKNKIETNTELKNRSVVFLCKCGDSNSSILDFEEISQSIFQMNEVYSIQEITQACTKEGSQKIKEILEKEKIAHTVLAACRCCNMEQICFSCTDRRVMCQNNLTIDLPQGVNIEYANIREQCAWIHKDDPDGATTKAVELISAAVVRAQKLTSVMYDFKNINEGVLIFSSGLSGLASARQMVSRVKELTVVFDPDSENFKNQTSEYKEKTASLEKEIKEAGIHTLRWPKSLTLTGTPGQYETALEYNNEIKRIKSGVVILDLSNISDQQKESLTKSNLISRIMARQHFLSRVSNLDSMLVHSYTVRETAGIFIIVEEASSIVIQNTLGEAAAARALNYLSQEIFKPRSSSVIINPKLCRGCGDCIKICPYIELKSKSEDVSYAYVDPALCFGCGACISVCPTGAIKQPLQSEIGLTATLKSLLSKNESVSRSI